MTWGLWGYDRTAAVVPGSTIFRGIDLSDLPGELSSRVHHAINQGSPDRNLHDNLLDHVGDNHGFSGWWTDDPDNAKHYAAGGHQDDNPLRAVLATDWNGEGQDYDYIDDEVGDDDVPLRDEPPRPHTVWVSKPGSPWVNISKGVPGPEERTAHLTSGLHLAASSEHYEPLENDFLDDLKNQFDDWAATSPDVKIPGEGTYQERGAIGHWPNVESFFKEKYPAAYKGLSRGLESAAPAIDSDSGDYCPYCTGAGYLLPDKNKCLSCNGSGIINDKLVYETGPEAEAKHGYDPKAVAAGLLYLHSQSHPYRFHMQQEDQNRLLEVFKKRMKMQRDYNNRIAAHRTAMPVPPVVMMHPDDVRQYTSEHNPIYGDNLKKITDDISRNGIQRPLSIHTNGEHAALADGHHRLMAAQSLGLDEVPVQIHYGWHDFYDDDPEADDIIHDYLDTHHPEWRRRTAHRTAMPYYHVSPHDLPDGTELTPSGGSSAFGPEVYNDPDHPGFEDHPNHVWMWDDLNKAVRFLPEIGAEENPDHSWEYGHVYEVQPDQEPHGSSQSGLQTNRATIIRKVPQHEYPNTWWNPPPLPKKARTMTAAVTVYTQPNCIQCTMTKRQLDKLGIAHDTVDVSSDPEAHSYVTGLGYTAAPVVVVNDGESHWAGFRPDRLKGLVSGE